jgi:hypothetical protein
MYHQTHHGALGSHRSHMDLPQKKYYENTNQQVARYKIEALGRRYQEIWGGKCGLVERLHAFQKKYFEDRQSIGN